MQKKILITWWSSSLGGAEESIIDLSNYLSERKKIKVILLFIESKKIVFPKNKLKKEVKLYNFSFSLPIYKILSFFIVLWICLKENIDIVNVNYRAVVPESFAAKLLGKEVVSTVRAVLIDKNNSRCFAFTDMIIAISNSVAIRLREIGYLKGIRIIYNGICLKNFEIFKNSKKIGSEKSFYFMARLVKWKRPDWFIKAATIINKENPNSKFIIFGEGPERKSLEKMISENGLKDHVKLEGFVSKNDPRLKNCDICVLPSYIEPFGKVIVEAIIRGKVVVATKSGGIPEILRNYDLLFERDNFEDLVNKMKKAYANFDYYQSVTLEMQKDMIKKFRMERVAEDYYNLFVSL